MPGYAYPVGSTVESGAAKSVSYLIADTNSATATSIYTAPSKTKVVAVTAVHTKTGILPVNLYVGRVVGPSIVKHIVAKARVFKVKALVLPVVSGDTRVGDDGPATADYNKISAEFVLQTGEKLYATCPVANEIELHIEVREGVK